LADVESWLCFMSKLCFPSSHERSLWPALPVPGTLLWTFTLTPHFLSRNPFHSHSFRCIVYWLSVNVCSEKRDIFAITFFFISHFLKGYLKYVCRVILKDVLLWHQNWSKTFLDAIAKWFYNKKLISLSIFTMSDWQRILVTVLSRVIWIVVIRHMEVCHITC